MRRLLATLALGACACVSPPAAVDAASLGARATWKQVRTGKQCARAARSQRRVRPPRSRRACPSWRAAVPIPGGPGAPPERPPGSTTPPPEQLGSSLQVRAREYSLTLSRNAVATGDVTVEFNTVAAEDPHDLWLRDALGGERALFGETAPELVPPPREAFPLAVGEYLLFCSVSGHEALGMRAALSVR